MINHQNFVCAKIGVPYFFKQERLYLLTVYYSRGLYHLLQVNYINQLFDFDVQLAQNLQK